MANLNRQFRKFRQSKGVNQTRLSIWSGVSRSTIWRFESGKKDIKASSLEKMVDSCDGKLVIIDKDL
jgi:predicted transcriptional regulator